MATIFSLTSKYHKIKMCTHLYVDTEVEGSELHCYNTEGDRNSVVSQASFRMDVIRLEQRVYIKIAVLRRSKAREWHSELVVPRGTMQFRKEFLTHSSVILM